MGKKIKPDGATRLGKAETAAQRKKRGAANPQRTQDARDRLAFHRFVRNHPSEALEMMREFVRREDENCDDEAEAEAA